MILFYDITFNFAKQSRKKAPWPGFLSGLYLIGYGTVRFFIEFFREPDAQLGFVFLNFSTGQVLCFLMIAAVGKGGSCRMREEVEALIDFGYSSPRGNGATGRQPLVLLFDWEC